MVRARGEATGKRVGAGGGGVVRVGLGIGRGIWGKRV